MEDELHIEIAIDQWIREVDAADLGAAALSISFRAMCADFDIPEKVGKRFVQKAIED